MQIYKIKNTKIKLESRISHLHKIFYSAFSNFTMVLRVKDKNIVSSKFLYYYILYKYQKGFMRSMQTQTTGLHNLILDKYLAMPLYLPPYSEQQRIIKRIEVIFNTLDTIKESL